MNDIDLDRLAVLAEAATPGPWEWEPPSDETWAQYDESLVTAYVPEGEKYPKTVVSGYGYDASGTNATDEDRAFIAACSPDVVTALIERIRMAEGGPKEGPLAENRMLHRHVTDLQKNNDAALDRISELRARAEAAEARCAELEAEGDRAYRQGRQASLAQIASERDTAEAERDRLRDGVASVAPKIRKQLQQTSSQFWLTLSADEGRTLVALLNPPTTGETT